MILCIRTRVELNTELALFVYIIITIIYINIIYKYINNINVCVRRVVQKSKGKSIEGRRARGRNIERGRGEGNRQKESGKESGRGK
jgi:hypothetical protein